MRTQKLLILLCCGIILSSCKEKTETTTESPKIEFSNHDGKLGSGNIKRVDSFPSKFVRPRTVDVSLPSNYSETKKYAELYMHLQNVVFLRLIKRSYQTTKTV